MYSVTNIKFRHLDLRSDGLTMVPIKKTAFWDMTTCILVEMQ